MRGGKLAQPMAWVKLETTMLDTPKIRRLRRQQKGNDMCLLWFFLILLAGKSGTSGKLLVTDDIPCDIQDIADFAQMDTTFVGEALDQFITLNMVEIVDDNSFKICGWEEHQSIALLDLERKNKHVEAQQNYRKRKKQL